MEKYAELDAILSERDCPLLHIDEQTNSLAQADSVLRLLPNEIARENAPHMRMPPNHSHAAARAIECTAVQFESFRKTRFTRLVLRTALAKRPFFPALDAHVDGNEIK